jgi:hypothetical protein
MSIGRSLIGETTSFSLTTCISLEKLKILFEGMSAIVIFGIQLMSRMLCEADRRMTCEQLKAHPVSRLILPFSVFRLEKLMTVLLRSRLGFNSRYRRSIRSTP